MAEAKENNQPQANDQRSSLQANVRSGLRLGAYNEENREREIVNGRFAMPPSFDWLPEAITCDIGNL